MTAERSRPSVSRGSRRARGVWWVTPSICGPTSWRPLAKAGRRGEGRVRPRARLPPSRRKWKRTCSVGTAPPLHGVGSTSRCRPWNGRHAAGAARDRPAAPELIQLSRDGEPSGPRPARGPRLVRHRWMWKDSGSSARGVNERQMWPAPDARIPRRKGPLAPCPKSGFASFGQIDDFDADQREVLASSLMRR